MWADGRSYNGNGQVRRGFKPPANRASGRDGCLPGPVSWLRLPALNPGLAIDAVGKKWWTPLRARLS